MEAHLSAQQIGQRSAINSFGGRVAVGLLLGVLNINYLIEAILSIPAQTVSLISATVPFVIALGVWPRLVTAKWNWQHGAVIALFLLVSLFFPILDYLVHGAPSGFEFLFLWWLKREGVVLSLLLCGLLLANYKAEREFQNVAHVLFWLAVVGVVFSYSYPDLSYRFVSNSGDLPYSQKFDVVVDLSRAFGTFLASNLAATALVYGYVVHVCFLALNNARWTVPARAFTDTVFLVALTQTGSRLGVVMGAIAVATAAYDQFVRRRSFGRLIVYCVIAASIVFTLIVTGVLKGGFGTPLERLINPTDSDAIASTELRLSAQERALDKVSNHMFAGIGRFHMEATSEIMPHNAYLSQALSMGVVGTATYLAFLFLMWWASPKGTLLVRMIPVLFALQSLGDDLVIDTKQFGYVLAAWIVLLTLPSKRARISEHGARPI
jgi:hypothetical protein